MMSRTGAVRGGLLLAVLAASMLSSTGCGYLKNVRDDFLDIGTVAVGIVPPVVPTASGPKAIGFIPPAFGAYVQVTDLFHLGAIYSATGDLVWDRRGYGVMTDVRRKFGLGPIHDVYIKQVPILTNAYKRPEGKMAGWQAHMDAMKDPIFGASAKTMVFKPQPWALADYGIDNVSWESLPWLSHGWQDWETVSVEVAIPEPFILHTGFYARVGVDPSQAFDFLLGIFGVDLYGDAAYNFNGSLKY
jgi:hypothetical protein